MFHYRHNVRLSQFHTSTTTSNIVSCCITISSGSYPVRPKHSSRVLLSGESTDNATPGSRSTSTSTSRICKSSSHSSYRSAGKEDGPSEGSLLEG